MINPHLRVVYYIMLTNDYTVLNDDYDAWEETYSVRTDPIYYNKIMLVSKLIDKASEVK